MPGRGRADSTRKLIDTIVEIAEIHEPCNVRALAYQLFIRHLIPSMAKECTAKVSRLSVMAREEGLLPWDWITDNTRETQTVSTWKDPEAYARAVQQSYRRNKWEGQRKYIVTWSEKSTVVGTVNPVLDKYEADFQVLHGWSGATPVMDAVVANLRRKQDTLILYIGDYDPSGMYMSEVDLPKRLARYSSDDPSDKDITIQEAKKILKKARLEIRRIALTFRHTRKLGTATRFPASDKKDDKRYEWFVANHGHWCWELDAMPPNELRDLLEAAIVAELDREAWDRYVVAEEAEREAIIDTCTTWKSIFDPDEE